MFIGIKSLSSFYTLTSIAIKIQLSNIFLVLQSSVSSSYGLFYFFFIFISSKKLCHNILVNVLDVNEPWTVSMFPSIAVKPVKISVNLNNQPRLFFDCAVEKKCRERETIISHKAQRILTALCNFQDYFFTLCFHSHFR